MFLRLTGSSRKGKAQEGSAISAFLKDALAGDTQVWRVGREEGKARENTREEEFPRSVYPLHSAWEQMN